MINIYWLREEIGDAIWLWTLANAAAKVSAEDEWFVCIEGKGISDMQIGTALFCAREQVVDPLHGNFTLRARQVVFHFLCAMIRRLGLSGLKS
jgi:hypothetical protein